MIKLDIAPLSMNNCYITDFKTGRRFPSGKLKQFKKDMEMLVPKWKFEIKPKEKLEVQYEFGVSSKMIDGDNLIKTTQDALAELYGFNDRDIYRWEVEKVIVPKGSEYIKFNIQTWKDLKT
jgi:Holliday junction resolvase RusA-like endonuclease